MTTKGLIPQKRSDGRPGEAKTCRLEVQLKPTWIERVGYRYDVILDGETIVRQSRDPEYDAARVLHSRGLRGRFQTIDFRTGRPRMSLDIEKAAKLCTVERAGKGPPRVEAYRPFHDDAMTLRHGPPLHQGGAIPGWGASGTGQSIEAAGGEPAEASRRVPEEA